MERDIHLGTRFPAFASHNIKGKCPYKTVLTEASKHPIEPWIQYLKQPEPDGDSIR